MSFYWGKTCHVSIKKHQGNAGNYTEDLFASTKTRQLFKKSCEKNHEFKKVEVRQIITVGVFFKYNTL